MLNGQMAPFVGVSLSIGAQTAREQDIGTLQTIKIALRSLRQSLVLSNTQNVLLYCTLAATI